MIKLFPESRRPWSDSIASGLGLEDHRDPYERYFGLFGESEGAGGSDEDVDQNKQQGIAAKNAGLTADQFDYSGTGVSAPERSGTTFGVNGRSKTGSTAQDAAIGFTSAPGSGLPGANFGQLSNATAEQMSVVDSIAQQARQRDLSAEQTQAAVRNALSGYETGSVSRSGNLTDKGKSAVSAALEQATAPAPQATAAEVLGTDIFGPFPADQPQLNFIAPQISTPQSSVRAMDVMQLPARSPVRALQMSPFRGVSSDLLATRMTAQATPDEMRQDMLSELRTRAIVGDEAAIAQLEGQARAEELGLAGSGRVDLSAPAPSFDNPQVGLVPVGIASTPQATAAGVLQSTPATDMLVGQQTVPANVAQSAIDRAQFPNTLSPDVDSVAVNAPGGGMMSVPMNQTPINQTNLTPGQLLAAQQNIFGDDFQPAAPASAPATAALASGALPEMVDAETDLVARDLTDPNRAGYTAGLPTGLETYTRPDGVTVTSNLAGLTEAQREAQPFSMDVAGFLGSDPYGYELDSQGNPVGMVGTPGFGIISQGINALQNMIMGPPQTQEDLFNRGVYTGMSVQPDSGGDGGDTQPVAAQPVDPCPDGYQLVDGVCQPVDDITTDATTGLPTAVVPPLFEPFTQATQVGQINPFVLQPYAPQGIQGLSPTGAALGRQV
jgi:hypothetical protein